MPAIALVLVGIVAGIAGGLFGIGGGIIIVPVLVLLFGYAQKMAQGTSLVALLMPVGILGLANYYKAGQANLVAGTWIALGFICGAFFGSKIALGLDEVTMKRTFAVFLACVALYMWFSAGGLATSKASEVSSRAQSGGATENG
ncbi:MAG TPA: TSUP family transporter [Fimbriimonadaceae bacterium]|nr:TSUP family transporter [Fimbriimonadaceae bacterium]